MAVQPVHRTREQALAEALGARVPVATHGHFTLYWRAKTTHAIYVHDKRKGPESLPVTSFHKEWAKWSVYDGDQKILADNPVALFQLWLARRK